MTHTRVLFFEPCRVKSLSAPALTRAFDFVVLFGRLRRLRSELPIQEAHGETMIGSYPRYDDGRYTTQIVVRGRDQSRVDAAVRDVEDLLKSLIDAKTPSQ